MITVEADGKEPCDIEISGEQQIMEDLLSSSTRSEFSKKITSYIQNGQKPTVKILMDRTSRNSAKFARVYLYFLRRLILLR